MLLAVEMGRTGELAHHIGKCFAAPHVVMITSRALLTRYQDPLSPLSPNSSGGLMENMDNFI
jgi:hypothetical protein